MNKEKLLEIIKNLSPYFASAGGEAVLAEKIFKIYMDSAKDHKFSKDSVQEEESLIRHSDSLFLKKRNPRFGLVVGLDSKKDRGSVIKVSSSDISGEEVGSLSLIALTLLLLEDNEDICIVFSQGAYKNQRGIRMMAPYVDSVPSLEGLICLEVSDQKDAIALLQNDSFIPQKAFLNHHFKNLPLNEGKGTHHAVAIEQMGISKDTVVLGVRSEENSVKLEDLKKLYDLLRKLCQWGSSIPRK